MLEYRAYFPNTHEAAVKARHALLDFVRLAGFVGSALDDIESAVGEALANAAEHGHREASAFSVCAKVKARTLIVEVRDFGPGFHSSNAVDFLRPMSDAPRGFGIFIMRTLMDMVEYTEGGSCVRLTKKLQPVASSECRRA
jgi:anti-sigma regulatory factor (Ser/Thr protein kinase)